MIRMSFYDKKERDSYMISETGNWNVADAFAKRKIMNSIDNCVIYEDVAKYGYTSFIEELMNYNVPVEEIRVRGLRRFIDELIRLCKTAKFAMKKEGSKHKLFMLKDRLFSIRDEVYPYVFTEFIDEEHDIRGIKINEDLFDKVIEAITEIQSNMFTPLNENHLIFVDKEEFDPIAFKNRIRDRIVNRG